MIPIKKISIENRMVDLERKMIPVSSSLIREDCENNSKYMEKFVVSDLKGCGNSSLFFNQNNKIEVIRCQK